MNNATNRLSAGTIKLYQKGFIGKFNGSPDILKECEHYYSVTERKKIISIWTKKYGSKMNYHYLLISPGKFLSRTTRK